MANIAYLNPYGEKGNPMNLPGSGVGGVYRNPSGSMGNPINMPQSGIAIDSKQMGPAPAVGYSPSPFDQVYADYQKAHDTATGETMKRRTAALGLVGFDPNYQLGGTAYGPPGGDPSLVQQRAFGPTPAEVAARTPVAYAPPVTAPVFSGKSVTAGRERVRGAASHLMNTSTVLNRVKTGTDQDRFTNDMATLRANQDLQQTAREQQRFDAGQDDRMLDRRLGLLERFEDEGPDGSQLADLAFRLGQGNSGGGGGTGYSGGGGGGLDWSGNAGAMGYGPRSVGGGSRSGSTRKPPMQGPRAPTPSRKLTTEQRALANKSAADMARKGGAKPAARPVVAAPAGYVGTDPNAGAGFFSSAPTQLGKPAVAYGDGAFGKSAPVTMGDFVWDETRGWVRSRG